MKKLNSRLLTVLKINIITDENHSISFLELFSLDLCSRDNIWTLNLKASSLMLNHTETYFDSLINFWMVSFINALSKGNVSHVTNSSNEMI